MSSCREEAAPEGGEFFTFARIQTRQCCWVPSVPLRAVWSHCPPQTAANVATWQPAGHCRAAACFVGPLILTVPGSHPPEPGATSSRPPTLNGWGLWPALLLTPSGQSTLAVLLPLWLMEKPFFHEQPLERVVPCYGLSANPLPRDWPDQGVVQYTEYGPDAHPWLLFFLAEQTSFSLSGSTVYETHQYISKHISTYLSSYPPNSFLLASSFTFHLIRGVIKFSFQGAVSLCNAAGLKFSCYGRQSDWNGLCLLI